MASITLDCDVAGESDFTAMVAGTSTPQQNLIQAIAIRDQTEKGLASEIQLLRYRDRASPKLAELCAGGKELGAVTINIFNAADGLAVHMTLKLSRAFVSRIEFDTLDSTGTALERHDGAPDLDMRKKGKDGAKTVNDLRGYSRSRSRPSPIFAQAPGTPTNIDVERIWLNYRTVTWTFASGNVQSSFNNSDSAG